MPPLRRWRFFYSQKVSPFLSKFRKTENLSFFSFRMRHGFSNILEKGGFEAIWKREKFG